MDSPSVTEAELISRQKSSQMLLSPLKTVEMCNKLAASQAQGGGCHRSEAGAVRLGVSARAARKLSSELRVDLKKEGHDPRPRS